MEQKDLKRSSKFLSLVLRHKPEEIGISLDQNGWTDVKVLLSKLQSKGIRLTKQDLTQLVETNDKKRFAFNADGSKIRANQGHSLQTVDIEFEEKEPPLVLYHGTSTDHHQLIMKSGGLKKMNRHHVHLSSNIDTAKSVGSRYGRPCIIEVNSKQMHDDGYKFYQSANGVWLTDCVPECYFNTTHFE